MATGLTDTHCHLSDPAFDDDRAEVIKRAHDAGVTQIVAVGGGGPIEASEDAARLASQYPFMRSTAGIHPHDAGSYDDSIEQRIEALLQKPEVVAVGETGLDYHYNHSPHDQQRESLLRHLELARKHRVPIVLHCRNAEDDMLEILRAHSGDGLRGVVHCFTGSYEDARAYLDLGLMISLTGIITFGKADELRDIVGRLPLDRLMVETDSPYLAPVPHRGKRNEPAFVKEVAMALAELKKVDLEEVVDKTGENAAGLFFKPSPGADRQQQ